MKSSSIFESPDIFREHARTRLSPSPFNVAIPATGPIPGQKPSDFDLNPGLAEEIGNTKPPRPAAVLIPVVARSPMTVLFTLRTSHLAAHAGQVSFPGGKMDADDPDALTTALREAEEEIALPRNLVEPLGFLDTYRTSTGFSVQPLVALVSPDHGAVPNPDEVAEIFEVPLAFLMNRDNITRNARIWMGQERWFYAFTFESRYIWGATAGMLNNMHERLFRE